MNHEDQIPSEDATQFKDQSDPPEYTPSCLKPFTAMQNARYDNRPTVQPIPIIIDKGLHSNLLPEKPQYIPSGWQEHFNPEGARYFVNRSRHVVTDSAITEEDVYEALQGALREFDAAVALLEKPLPQDCELFIQLEGEDDLDCCKWNYYLVDHSTRTEFWLHQTDTYAMVLGRITTESHLKLVLQKHYWTHVDYYPHTEISLQLRQELVNILRHGQLDVMTSKTSTFPYTVEQCERYIKLLHDCMNDPPDMYITCLTARVWSSIAHHRAENFYGEAHARLERDHYVFGQPTIRRSWIMTAIFCLFFGIPARTNNALEALYVDDAVYGIHWQKFMSNMIDSWKDSRLMAAFSMIVNALLLVAPKGPMSMYLGLASILCGVVSLIASQGLLQRYTGAEELVAEVALKELQQLAGGLRFQTAAVVYSLPKALVHWSIVLLGFAVFSVLLEVSTEWATIVMAALLSVAVSAVLVTFIVRRGMRAWHQYRSQKAVQSLA